ncbi:UDP-galactopyranose mutase [Nibricoccus sp. IMCC34717]|uniref:UDP-galactopyranose mutase n=1 Tax=Nibricoccus sp. IMCC34717 TaxID=3034021 RepID=UPI00384D13B3
MKKALIIGGGFSGCAAAHQLTLMGGWDITLVESSHELGAGVRTRWYGGHPYTFGPRHFLTQNEEVYAYLDKLVPLRPCADHQFITYVESDNQFYNFPIHMDDVRAMPEWPKIQGEMKAAKGAADSMNLEEYWINSVGPTLYKKFIDSYSKKMWLVDDNRTLDTFNWSPKGVAIKDGPRAAWDTAKSAYPYAPDGYNSYFEISTHGAKVLLNTTIERYNIPEKQVYFLGENRTYDLIVNTISPDLIFEECHGALPYIGRDFHKIVLPGENVFPEHVYFIYYANSEEFTRLVEYKRFTHHRSSSTLIGMEIPSLNGRHYPLPLIAEQEKAEKYFSMMPDGVFSLGRAGCYRYSVDIDDCIEQTFDMARQVKSGLQEHAVPVAKNRKIGR